MKKRNKILKYGALVLGVLVLTSCTQNFCSPEDKAHIMFTYDRGVDDIVVDGDTTTVVLNNNLAKVIDNAKKNGFQVPSNDFWTRLDEETLKLAFPKYAESYPDETAGMTLETITPEVKAEAMYKFGYFKYLGTKDAVEPSYGLDLWANWNIWVHELGLELGIENVPDRDFNAFYMNSLNGVANVNRSCIALDSGEYGVAGSQHYVTSKSWGYAWSKGFLEGLLVYPVAALVESLTKAFGAGGWGQIGAILITTLIVRGVLILLTLKQTLGMQKMNALQPEIAKLQQKYPNANTNQYEKQALAQAQMQLYKKHKINPLGTLIILLIQFPIFISVWGAMTGSASLSSDAVLGLNLSDQLGATMTRNFFSSGWWTAVVLFLLMATSQFISSRLQGWITKHRNKNDVVRLGKSPTADQNKSQTKMMQNVMLIVIIVMSWTLPAAMGVYWLVGALISIAQTLIIDHVMNRKKKTVR